MKKDLTKKQEVNTQRIHLFKLDITVVLSTFHKVRAIFLLLFDFKLLIRE